MDNTRINQSDIGDIVVGTVLGPGSKRANEFRMAAFNAGYPGKSICLQPWHPLMKKRILSSV